MRRPPLLILLLLLGPALAGCTACFDAFDQYNDAVSGIENQAKAGPSGIAPQVASSLPGGAGMATSASGLYRPDRRLAERMGRNEIPQIDGRWDLFADLKDGPVDPATGGVLFCDLRLPGTPWYASRPDMEAGLTLGGQPTMYLVGEDNRDATVVTAPIPALKAGDPIKLVLEDRDLFGRNDHLDSASGSYAGVFPLLLVGDARELHATCRGMRRDEVQRRVALRRTDADRALTTFDQARAVDLSAPDFGYPWPHHEDAEAALEQVPALVGWSDPSVRPLMDRLEAVKTAWDTDARAAVKQTTSSATPVATQVQAPGGRVNLALEQVACDAGVAALFAAGGVPAEELQPQCVIELRMTSPVSAVTLPPYSIEPRAIVPGAGGVDVVLPDGRTEALYVRAVFVDGSYVSPPPTQVAQGADVRLLVEVQYDHGNTPTLQQGVMARVERGSSPLFLLLR